MSDDFEARLTKLESKVAELEQQILEQPDKEEIKKSILQPLKKLSEELNE